MKDVFKFILDNWILLAPLVYEILARLWPTKWNVSILDNLWTILNKIIPNIRKEQPTDEKVSLTKNKIVVDTKKHILKTLLILFLFSITLTSQAQTWQAYKGIWLKNYDTLSSVPAIPSGYGAFVATDFGLYAYDTAWFNLRQDSTSGGGITNTAGVNELGKSDGTNIVPSGFFSSVLGDLLLGDTTQSGGQRTITVQGSAASISATVLSKGTNPAGMSVGDANASFSFTNGGSFLFTPNNLTTNFDDNITVKAGTASSATAGKLILEGGTSNGVAFGAGDIEVRGGNAILATGNQSGGNVIIYGGEPSGSGTQGAITFPTLPDVALKASLPVGAIYDSLSYIKRKH